MKIGHYEQGISRPGGVGTYIRRLSNAQSLAGHTVYYLDTWPLTGDPGRKIATVIVGDESDLFMQAKTLGLDILHLHRHVSFFPPDCVPLIRTVHNNNPYCPSGTRYLKRSSQPCDRPYSFGGCLWGHLIDYCGSIRPQRFYPGFQRTWQDIQTLDKVTTIANSQFVKDQMLRSNYPADNLHVLHYPAPDIEEYFSPEQGELPHFIFLGRITPEKGLVWLLRALAEVKVPIHMDIAGTGTQQQEQAIRHLADRLGLMNKITFHGWVNEAKTIQLIHKARALVFPSVWHEPAGLVSLEAAAAGRPIIASKVGGIPEYALRLQNALLVEPNDVGGLARSIEQLAEDWSLAQQMGAEGLSKAKEYFALESHLQELARLYQLALDRHRRLNERVEEPI